MQEITVEASPMARKKSQDKPDPIGRFELKARKSWLVQAEAIAKSLGLSMSAYIRMVVSEDMRRRRESPHNR